MGKLEKYICGHSKVVPGSGKPVQIAKKCQGCRIKEFEEYQAREEACLAEMCRGLSAFVASQVRSLISWEKLGETRTAEYEKLVESGSLKGFLSEEALAERIAKASKDEMVEAEKNKRRGELLEKAGLGKVTNFLQYKYEYGGIPSLGCDDGVMFRRRSGEVAVFRDGEEIGEVLSPDERGVRSVVSRVLVRLATPEEIEKFEAVEAAYAV